MSSASIFVSRSTSALAAASSAASAARRRRLRGRRRDLRAEALQRPVAAPLDLGRDVGQRHDRADRLALAGELERRDVALDAVVVGGQRRRAGELDGAVLADEPAARAGRARRRRRRWRRRPGWRRVVQRCAWVAPSQGNAPTTTPPRRLVPENSDRNAERGAAARGGALDP